MATYIKATRIYIENGVDKEAWCVFNSTAGTGATSVASSDGNTYTLLLNVPVCSSNVSGGLLARSEMYGSYVTVPRVCSIGKKLIKLIGLTSGGDKNFYGVISGDCYADGFSRLPYSATVRGTTNSYGLKWLSSGKLVTTGNTQLSANYNLFLVDLESAGFSDWGISRKFFNASARYFGIQGTMADDGLGVSTIADVMNYGLYDYSYNACSNKVTATTTQRTFFTKVVAGSVNIYMKSSVEGVSGDLCVYDSAQKKNTFFTDNSSYYLVAYSQSASVLEGDTDTVVAYKLTSYSDNYDYTVNGWYVYDGSFGTAEVTEASGDLWFSENKRTVYVRSGYAKDVRIWADVTRTAKPDQYTLTLYWTFRPDGYVNVKKDGVVVQTIKGTANLNGAKLSLDRGVGYTFEIILYTDDYQGYEGTAIDGWYKDASYTILDDGDDARSKVRTITLNEDKTLYIKAVLPTHRVSLYCVPPGAGTVACGAKGSSSISLVVEQNKTAGYAIEACASKTADGLAETNTFLGWYVDPECTTPDTLKSEGVSTSDSTEAYRSINNWKDITLYAKFSATGGYCVSASAVALDGTTAPGCTASFTPDTPDFTDTQAFANKREITFTATAAEGWDFYGWRLLDEDVIDTNSGSTKKMKVNGADLNVLAVFAQAAYTFNVAWDSASQGIDEAQFARQKWNEVTGVWESLSDNEQIDYGDKVRVYVRCGSTGYALGKVTNADGTTVSNAIRADGDGTNFYVQFDSVTTRLDLRLYLAGRLNVAFDGTDGWVSATIYGEDGTTVVSETQKGGTGNAATALVPLGAAYKIATKKLAACTNYDYDFMGWHLDGEDALEDVGKEASVTVSAPSASYVAKWEIDKNVYIKARLGDRYKGFGTINIYGGTDIPALVYRDAKAGFSIDEDPAGTRYLRCTRSSRVVVSLAVNNGRKFLSWSAQNVQPGEPPTYSDETAITTSRFTITASAHKVYTAQFVASDLRILTVHGNGATVSFSPGGTNPTASSGIVSASYYNGDVVSVLVVPPAGKAVGGLYTDASFTNAYSGTSVQISDADVTLYVQLVDDTHAVFAFGMGDDNMTAHWRSKLFVATRPWSPSSLRVEADAYKNLRIRVLQASSPDKAQEDEDVFDRNAKPLTIKNQEQRRIALRRPEKHTMIDVETADPVSTVMVASSSGGLVL